MGLGSTIKEYRAVESEPALARHQHQYVMVIDSNAVTRGILHRVLQQLGLKCVATPSVKEAIAMVGTAELPTALVCFVEWQPSGTGGKESWQQLQSAFEACAEHMPGMILMAAHENDEGMHLASLKADGVIVKPITTRNVQAQLQRYLGACAPHAALRADLERPSWLPFHDWDILVVEDVDFNQEVIIELLASVGVQTRLASNGLEALREVARKAPDAILMDCHMPVMDGFEATRRLRANPDYSRIPIIALTASVMEEDKKRCSDAGMNAYVAKPVDLGVLHKQLLQFLPPAASLDVAHLLDAQREAPEALIPLAGLDMQQGLAAMGGRQPVYIRLLKKFNDNFAKAFEPQFRSAVQSEDWMVAERLVHSLKGVAQTLGAKDLVQSTIQLEASLRQRHVEQIFEILRQVVACLTVISDSVSCLDAQLAPMAVAGERVQQIDQDSLQRLATLTDMLARRETDATELALELDETMSRTEFASDWKAVAGAIDRYDFSAAEKKMLLLRDKMAHRRQLQQGT
jgi:CheY-like chemotaxis protein